MNKETNIQLEEKTINEEINVQPEETTKGNELEEQTSNSNTIKKILITKKQTINKDEND